MLIKKKEKDNTDIVFKTQIGVFFFLKGGELANIGQLHPFVKTSMFTKAVHKSS